MEKIVKIGDKTFQMKSSAYTQLAYRNETNRSFLNDIKKLVKLGDLNLNDLKADEQLDLLDDLQELILPISYVMVKEADKTQAQNYEEFLKSLDNLYEDFEWVNEVILLACSPISRQLQNS